STRYTRCCVVCVIENPRQRAVFTRCGHIVCYPCAVDNSRSPATEGKCVYCRAVSGFVKLFEDECGEKKNDVIDENRSMMRTIIDCGKTAEGGRFHSLLSNPFTWSIVRDATCIGLGLVLFQRAPPNARIFVGIQLFALAN
ncbi:hypothetical protein PMAYCL1PPCAC_11549, partial [Pristionchus mayeri]